MSGVFALVDMDSFYASVEAVFRPSLRGKPVCVLSNGDGNVVARSREAKALSVAMGQPAFELRPLVQNSGLILLSSNYALYGDMSERIHSILRDYAPEGNVYSIDEIFLRWGSLQNPVDVGQRMRAHVLQWCGVPCRVGFGRTKTLAKIANRRAKRGDGGVVDLSSAEALDEVLADTPIEEVWGIGPRWGARLRDLGVSTALALREAPAALLRQRLGVVVARTQRELQGHACLSMEEAEPDRKQIFCSRTFGTPVTDQPTMQAAVASYVTRAAERMRERGLAASAMQVFFHTSPFRKGPQWAVSRTVGFATACDDTRVMLAGARAIVAEHWRSGIPFAKAGVGLLDLVRAQRSQSDLFAHQSAAAEGALMTAVDQINRRFGRNTLRFGTQALVPEKRWQMRQASISPRYTTRWSDVLKADAPRSAG